jgi:hypothetical protein
MMAPKHSKKHKFFCNVCRKDGTAIIYTLIIFIPCSLCLFRISLVAFIILLNLEIVLCLLSVKMFAKSLLYFVNLPWRFSFGLRAGGFGLLGFLL